MILSFYFISISFIYSMPGPATLFTTIGAVGAAASAVVYATKAQPLPDAQQVCNQAH